MKEQARCLACENVGPVWHAVPDFARTIPRKYARLLGWAFFASRDDGAIVCVACGGYDVEGVSDADE